MFVILMTYIWRYSMSYFYSTTKQAKATYQGIVDYFVRNPKLDEIKTPDQFGDKKENEHMELWVDMVMNFIKSAKDGSSKNLFDNKCAWGIHIVFNNFRPEDLEYYQALQERIAQEITDEQGVHVEQLRPTITLKIRGKNYTDSKTPFFGYIGGTGPLSDAATILSVREQYSASGNNPNDNLCVDLISAPPPRLRSTFNKLMNPERIYVYVRRVTKFMTESGSSNFILLSNTAHLNIFTAKVIKFLTHTFNLDLEKVAQDILNKSPDALNDMTKRVVDNIENGDIDQGKLIKFNKGQNKVAIFGTKEARKNNLYGKMFKAKQMNYAYPSKDTKEKHGDELQKIIDSIKNGFSTINQPNKNTTAGEDLVQHMIDHLDGTESHILLSCTEIPMCFHATDPTTNKTYRDLFEEAYAKKFHNKALPYIIDTEEKFVEYSMEMLLKNQEKSGFKLAQRPAGSKPTAPTQGVIVERGEYESFESFNRIHDFHDLKLMYYHADDESITVDFNDATKDNQVKKEMVIAAITAGIQSRHFIQPLILSGEDPEALAFGKQYCDAQGISYQVEGEAPPVKRNALKI